MSDERWTDVDRVLQSALSRPPLEREAFVREACKDDEALRDEVMSLLAHEGSAENFLEIASAPKREPLKPGARLGAYEIRAQIGEGGMGEVYRAHDSRLRRDIALKILPPQAADAERRQRFAREAQAIAALNHPGIVTIHSVEQSDNIHFLTMELVDGQTLDALTPKGGLPIDRLLAIAIPLADAVGTAHSQGIVHRDLKPANVMVTRDGRVKVMDFGLAKLSRRASLLDAKDGSGMTTAQLTEDGRIFGTVAYMSPEQAEGRSVDHRSDVFSLGVLLFELATGRRPFTGDSQVAVLASIVKDTPPSISDLKPGLPAEFARLVRKCLAKDPARRYQSVLDLRNDLEDLTGTTGMTGTTGTSGTPGVARRRSWILPVAAAVAVLAMASAVVFLVPGVRHRFWPAPPDKSSFAVTRFHNATKDLSLDEIGRQMTDEIISSLRSLGDGVSAERIKDSALGVDDVVRMVEGTGIGRVVGGTYYLNGDTIRVEVEVHDVGANGEPTYPFQPIDGPRAELLSVVRQVGNYVQGAVAFDKYRDWDGAAGLTRPIPYDAWFELRLGDAEQEKGNWQKELEHYLNARRLAPQSFMPKLLLFNRYVRTGEAEKADAMWREIEGILGEQMPVSNAAAKRYRATADGDLRGVLAASSELLNWHYEIRSLSILAEAQTRMRYLRAAAETYRRRLDLSKKVRSASDREGNRVSALVTLATIHHELGDFLAQLDDAKHGEREHPEAGVFFLEEASALIGLQKPLRDIEEVVDRARASGKLVLSDQQKTVGQSSLASTLGSIAAELRIHERATDAAMMSRRAVDEIRQEIAGAGQPSLEQSELLRLALTRAGDWKAAYSEYAALVKTEPDDISAQGDLGVIAAALGNAGEARAIAEALRKVAAPYTNGAQHYQRARVLASLGDAANAVVALKRSFEQGFGWRPGAIHRDAAFDPIRTDSGFKEFCEPKDTPAIAAIGRN